LFSEPLFYHSKSSTASAFIVRWNN